MQDIRKIVGATIKKNRKRLKMPQAVLAELVGVDAKYISRIETGVSYPSLSVVEKIFNVLNIDFNPRFEEIDNIDRNDIIRIINDNLKLTSINNLKVIKNIVETITKAY